MTISKKYRIITACFLVVSRSVAIVKVKNDGILSCRISGRNQWDSTDQFDFMNFIQIIFVNILFNKLFMYNCNSTDLKIDYLHAVLLYKYIHRNYISLSQTLLIKFNGVILAEKIIFLIATKIFDTHIMIGNIKYFILRQLNLL